MMSIGTHLIAGAWIAEGAVFSNDPVEGPPDQFHAGNPDLVDQAARAAEDAFLSFSALSRQKRADFLRRVADSIDAREDEITDIATRETGLPRARLDGERGRTTGQLRLFADHIEDGTYLDRRHDPALPDRAPLPRPDLRVIQRPVGPVAVFGASNFPLAFSVAGGDTASAFAAGCPVIVKGHEAHPGTSGIVATAINEAVASEGLHPGVFSMVHGGNHETGTALVQHPLVKAVGFTGSLRGGRALFDLCAARRDPIPFFGELGSVNPVFLMPQAMTDRAEQIAEGWAQSLTMGAGQFCTNPGLVIMIEGPSAEKFKDRAAEALNPQPQQTMLTSGITSAYRTGRDRLVAMEGLKTVVCAPSEGRNAGPCLLMTTGDDLLATPEIANEVFGPLGIIVTVRDIEQMLTVAAAFEGQLTATIHLEGADLELVSRLLPILERKAGRILANGFPTGVEVADAMVHGGPYPASTNFGATSVGTMAIRRWLRPVCFQDVPEALLPADLRH